MLAGEVEAAVSFDGLVAGRLVHRSHLSDVLVTDARRSGEDEFTCGVQWPVNHVFWGQSSRPESAIVAETIRQVTTYVAHVMYGVDLDQQFLMSRLEVELLAVEHRLSPLRNLSVVARFMDISRNRAGLTRFSSHIEVRDGSRPVATGVGHARLVGMAAYARTREAGRRLVVGDVPRHSTRITSAEAGVLDDGLVVVCAGGRPGVYELAVPGDSAAFFDHPLDHIPGMAIMEGIRQSVRHHVAMPAADFESIDVTFDRIVELQGATSVVLERVAKTSSGNEFRVKVLHEGVASASATGRIARRESALD